MKITKIKLENFRSYKSEVAVDFSDLTVFVGKNDIGKSTILEALDIFFNEGKGTVKIDKEDINKLKKYFLRHGFFNIFVNLRSKTGTLSRICH